jgi:DNA-binding ferritin-like protein
MMSETRQGLKEHLDDISERIQELSREESSGGNPKSLEWEAILEEKQCTQQGLNLCAQLSAQIELLAPTVEEDAAASRASVAHEYVKNGLNATKGSIQAMASLLKHHDDTVERILSKMTATEPLSGESLTELARLRATRESIQDCIEVISKADEDTAKIERQNIFEDITLADGSYSFTVSTIGDLVSAKKINLSGRSCNVGGQISDESFMAAIGSLVKGGLAEVPRDTKPEAAQSRRENPDGGEDGEFRSRYGKGMVLDPSSHSGKAASL